MMKGLCRISLVMLLLIGFSVTIEEEASAHGKRGRTTTVTDLVNLPDFSYAGGASILTRDRNEIWLQGSTTGLGANYAYTVWWIIFNNPKGCVDGCGEDEVFDDPPGRREPAKVSLLYATGFISGGHGTGQFTAHLKRGMSNAPGEVLFGYGLMKPQTAEVHIVIRCHGLVMPGMAAAQIGTFGGACSDTNPCVDVQAGVHLPPH